MISHMYWTTHLSHFGTTTHQLRQDSLTLDIPPHNPPYTTNYPSTWSSPGTTRSDLQGTYTHTYPYANPTSLAFPPHPWCCCCCLRSQMGSVSLSVRSRSQSPSGSSGQILVGTHPISQSPLSDKYYSCHTRTHAHTYIHTTYSDPRCCLLSVLPTPPPSSPANNPPA